MCQYPDSINMEYVHDVARGRFNPNGRDRFYRLDEYAYRRWREAKSMPSAARWLKVMEAVKRRGPSTQYRYCCDRMQPTYDI